MLGTLIDARVLWINWLSSACRGLRPWLRMAIYIYYIEKLLETMHSAYIRKKRTKASL